MPQASLLSCGSQVRSLPGTPAARRRAGALVGPASATVAGFSTLFERDSAISLAPTVRPRDCGTARPSKRAPGRAVVGPELVALRPWRRVPLRLPERAAVIRTA